MKPTERAAGRPKQSRSTMATPRRSVAGEHKTPGTASARRKTPSTLDRVISGRVQKHGYASPKPLDPESSLFDESSSRLDDVEREMESERYEEMMEEKKLFPGSDEWAADEKRLFEVLFMRQYSPIMPPHWKVDFRGIPLPDILFATSEVDLPVVYSQSKRDFRAAKAIIRLIDLTATTRAFFQMNQKEKIPVHAKRELDRFIRWAAADGDYAYPHHLPNLILEAVDLSIGNAGIENYMQSRLKKLAERHREFWLMDKDPLAIGKGPWTERPPVLYGLFIINTVLMVLTVDPTKGPDAHVSYQVEVSLNQQNQGVWNAITIAIVVCLARDGMVARRRYFEK